MKIQNGKDLIGKVLGNFELKELIGEGYLTYVYKAWDNLLEVWVAVKVLKPIYTEVSVFRRLFLEEAMATAKLRHPNIVSIKYVRAVGDIVYSVMEYMPRSVRRLMADGRLAVRKVVRYGMDVMKALGYAHGMGIVHGNIKPENIFVDAFDNGVIGDFGVAKALDRFLRDKSSGLALVTPEYMSPEKVEGKSLDNRSDIYSLSCTLYEMVTGRPPFVGEAGSEVERQHIEMVPELPTALNPHVPESLERVIMKSLEKRPEDRFDSMDQMYEEFLKISRDLSRNTDEPKRKVFGFIGDKINGRKGKTRRLSVLSNSRYLFMAFSLLLLGMSIYAFHSRRRGQMPPVGGGGGFAEESYLEGETWVNSVPKIEKESATRRGVTLGPIREKLEPLIVVDQPVKVSMYMKASQMKDIPGVKENDLSLWVRVRGGRERDVGYSVIQDTSGTYVIAGATYSYGSGSTDVYLLKMDSYGNEIWEKTFGGPYKDWAQYILKTEDGGYVVVGGTESFGKGSVDILLVKYSPEGEQSWYRTYGGYDRDWARHVEQTRDGGFIIVGGTESYGAGSTDVYLVKIDNNGDQEWNMVFGGSGRDVGYFVKELDEGGYIVVGGTESFGGSEDIYVIKVDPYGGSIWERVYGGNLKDRGYSFLVLDNDNILIVGYTETSEAGNADVCLLMLDSDGNVLWSRAYGGPKWDWGKYIVKTEDMGYLIVGGTQSFGIGKTDVYLLKVNFNGDIQWSKTYGNVLVDMGSGICPTPDGGFVIAGESTNEFTGKSDVLIIKVDSAGNTRPIELVEVELHVI